MSQVCHFPCDKITAWKNRTFSSLVRLRKCTNTYLGWGWSEAKVRYQCSGCYRCVWGSGTALPECSLAWCMAALHTKHFRAGDASPFGPAPAHACITWLQGGCMKEERIESVLCLSYALVPWNTPQCCCLLRSGLKALGKRLWCPAGQELPIHSLGTNAEAASPPFLQETGFKSGGFSL